MKYVVPSFLITTDPKSGIIQNTYTSERFEVTPEVLKLLRHFRKPHTISEVLGAFQLGSKRKREVRGFLKEACRNHLLVPYPEVPPKWGPSMLALTNKALVQSTCRTFFSCPSTVLATLRHDDIVFLGAPFDLGTTGFPGARFGPDRLRELSSEAYEYQADIFNGQSRGWFSLEHGSHVLDGRRLCDVGNVILQIGESFDQFYNRISIVVDRILSQRAFPILIGGDHGCSYAPIRSFKKWHGSIGVIHIDAHTDLGDLLPGIPNNHGNIFTRVLNEGLVDRLYQFGVRGMIGKSLDDKRYTLCSLKNLTDGGIGDAVAQIDPKLCYYLSLDIDVLDPAFAPGTGTAVPCGMSISMLFELLSQLASRVKILGLDLVEVNPMRDSNDQTASLANVILVHLLTEIRGGKNRKK